MSYCEADLETRLCHVIRHATHQPHSRGQQGQSGVFDDLPNVFMVDEKSVLCLKIAIHPSITDTNVFNVNDRIE